MYKVSVVVPIYKVEDYIVRCAESLFRQTLDDMQFIFVDDASPDNSIALLEQVLERFPQRKSQTIILHHPENLGIPTARATGLARVEAPYVAHCDSDDYVEPTMYAKLYENAMQNDSDMVMCGVRHHRPDGREYSGYIKRNPEESLIINYLHGGLGANVWNRLTRTDIYRRVKFPKENYYEDGVLTVQLLTYSKRISFFNEDLYHYIRHPMSITMDKSVETTAQKIRQCEANFKLMHDFIMEHHPITEDEFYMNKINLRNQFLFQTAAWSIRKKYLQMFPEINYSMLFNRKVPLFYREFHLLILLGLFPIIYPAYSFVKQKVFRKSLKERPSEND